MLASNLIDTLFILIDDVMRRSIPTNLKSEPVVRSGLFMN